MVRQSIAHLYQTPINHIWITLVQVITLTSHEPGFCFVKFPHNMPLVAVHQMSPQTAFLLSIKWIQQKPFSETVWVAPSCSSPCTRWESPLTQITEARWRKASSCLQALHRRQQGTSCCMPPCCFLLCCKCSVLWEQMKRVRLLKLCSETSGAGCLDLF